MNNIKLSLVVPAFNESQNIPVLYQRIVQTLEPLGLSWELIFVDDHSSDQTFEVIKTLAAENSRVQGYRLARNSGSHTAILCGLDHASGACAVVLASDLQDPPETIPDLLKAWETGNQVVWAERAERAGESQQTVFFAKLYYWIMRHWAGIKQMPASGADFFLIDRAVIKALRRFSEAHVSLFILISWLGFKQISLPVIKDARQQGRSGWTLEKKLKLLIDSVTSFTYLPIRFMSYVGFVVAMIGFGYAVVVIANAVAGQPTEGWSSLMIVTLTVGGLQMLMMGVLGEYLWRTLDETKRRPRYLIETSIPAEALEHQTFDR